MQNNNYDTRVTVIEKRAFAYRRYVRKNDFRASGSGNFDTNKDLIDLRCVKVALDISKKMKFQSMAYDFLYDDEDKLPKFSEISYAYIDWMVHAFPGYWDSGLNWHEGHFWPQYFHLMDSLNMPDLKQVEMEL